MHLDRQGPNALRVVMKVSIATNLKESLVVGMRGMPGNPYDDRALAEKAEASGILVEYKPVIAIERDR